MKSLAITIPEGSIREFCERHHIKKLSLFGSVLRDDFTPNSDVDVLVEFEPGYCVGLITFAGIENELSDILGRKADINTLAALNPCFREEVLSELEPLYVST